MSAVCGLEKSRLPGRIGKSFRLFSGDGDRASSEGCNLRIRDGAFPVLDPDDLVEELGLVHDLSTVGG